MKIGMRAQPYGRVIGRLMRRIRQDRRGSVIILTALLMPAVLGFSALGVDATLWYLQRRELQSIADAAAIAGTVVTANDINGDAEAAAIADAARNDFVVGDGRTLTVSTPPTSGAYAGMSGYVEVRVTEQPTLYFVDRFVDGQITIAARSVAGAVVVGEHCIIGLDHTMDRAVEFAGTANVYVECGVASNSNSAESLYLGGTADLVADPAQAYGDIYIGGNASLTTKHPPQPLSQRVDDPYSYLSPPSSSMTCAATNMRASGTVPLSPGKYCGGLTVQNGNVTFSPGTYIINNGDFDVRGTSTLAGDGVTFILTGDSAAKVGNLKITGGTVANLTASTSGAYEGVLFYQDAIASAGGSNSVLGGSSMELEGALYFPSQEILFSGGSGAKPACLQIIADKVTFQGNGYVGNDSSRCGDLNVKKITQVRVKIVE